MIMIAKQRGNEKAGKTAQETSFKNAARLERRPFRFFAITTRPTGGGLGAGRARGAAAQPAAAGGHYLHPAPAAAGEARRPVTARVPS